jgi:hypothetical protein
MTPRQISKDQQSPLRVEDTEAPSSPLPPKPDDRSADQTGRGQISVERQARLDSAVMILVNYLISIHPGN